MHVCKIVSPANSNNNYYITFYYLDIPIDVVHSEIDINTIVNYIRLHYKINDTPYVVEYDNIEFEILSSTPTSIVYKLLLTKLNYKLKLLPPNTECEINVFFKRDIDDPVLMIAK
jgi:hypothetical protein